MKNFLKIAKYISLTFFIHLNCYSQNCDDINIEWRSDIGSSCNSMVITMIHDQLDRPYLYVANKEGGLTIYDISSLDTPLFVATVPASEFAMLDVMNVSQSGNYLYLAIGNSFTSSQQGGMAIVNVSDPTLPVVSDYYVVPNSSSGGGIVKVEGNYAYLGAMQSGLVILDITDKSNIQFVSQFVPDINFPPVSSPNPAQYNARGMEVKNSIVYLCYDAGGIRIINCTDKFSPKETGQWCNPVMYEPFNIPKAYNNIVLNDTLAYVAVDYCGMEVLNIADTSNISLIGWWNPYNCPDNNWFTSPVHTNEIHFNENCMKVFLSTGESDLQVLDVSDPEFPDSCNYYGGVSNDIGTWGVGLYEDQIYLSYICVPLGIPFFSSWTGVKILTYNSCELTAVDNKADFPTKFSLSNNYPNPFNPSTIIEFSVPHTSDVSLRIYDILGVEVATLVDGRLQAGAYTKSWNAANEPSGVYFYRLEADKFSATKKLILLK